MYSMEYVQNIKEKKYTQNPPKNGIFVRHILHIICDFCRNMSSRHSLEHFIFIFRCETVSGICGTNIEIFIVIPQKYMFLKMFIHRNEKMT